MICDNRKIYKRDFWAKENLSFSSPYFRLEKLGRIVNSIAGAKSCKLLDIGCGPATLAKLLHENIEYFGIDIAIHDTAPNLIEMDILENAIKFEDLSFDIVVASGLFEYMGDSQRKKFEEIEKIMVDNGKLILTYSNLRRYRHNIPPAWNNIMPIERFRDELGQYFNIDRVFPCSHNRKGHPSARRFTRYVHMHLNVYIPVISPLLALDYFFICTKKSKSDAYSL